MRPRKIKEWQDQRSQTVPFINALKALKTDNENITAV